MPASPAGRRLENMDDAYQSWSSLAALSILPGESPNRP
jgi:hypothetical protein